MMDNENPIKAVVFDLGNVIARVDFQRPFLGINCFLNAPLKPSRQAVFMDKVAAYERGEVLDEQILLFLQTLIREENPLLPVNVPSITTLRDIWNSMIADLPAENLRLIQQVKKRYKTCLLSNTNHLHIQYIKGLQSGVDFSFESLFDRIYLSYELKLSKPDPEIYRCMLRDLGLPASQCLFIDDRVENIQSARKEGIRTFLLDDFNLSGLFTAEGELSAGLRKNMV